MIRSIDRFGFRRHQRGVAALTVALVILVLVTLITIAASQIGIGEQRNAANTIRSREAKTMGEAGIERGAVYLRQNGRIRASTAAGGWMQAGNVRWAFCTAGETAPPCGDGAVNIYNGTAWTAYRNVPNQGQDAALQGTFETHLLARSANGAVSPAPGRVYQVVANGFSEDGTAREVTRQGFFFAPFIARRPDSPIIAAGTVGLSGTISVVANPNAGGQGVPLSVWSGGDTTQTGSMQTCHVQEFLDSQSDPSRHVIMTDSDGDQIDYCQSCTCPNNPADLLSTPSREGIDILDRDGGGGANPDTTNFPPDVFQYVFGVPEAQFQSVKDMAEILGNCDSLNASSSGLYWITGECRIQTVVGSLEAPLILVIENGAFRMNANGAFFGVLFAFENGGTVTVDINGGPTLYGSLISNRNVNLGNGTYTARYSTEVLDNLANGSNAPAAITQIPGSWTDF